MKMKINSKDFRVGRREKVKLRQWPTIIKPFCKSKKQYQKLLEKHVEELSSLQQLHYASNRYALLLTFQGMDAAGKDGAIRHVMSGVNPQGCQVFSFKHPSPAELQHDFLWRTTEHLPERGHIGIFNRSYYEEVLVVRVHPQILKAQKVPPSLVTKDIWKERFEDIRCFERHMARNGTVIRKFFLHLSKKEQKRRFMARLDTPDKNWKFSSADIKEREFWDAYQEAYEEMIRHTASAHAPWYVVPADNKWFTRIVVAQAVVDTLKVMDLKYPKVSSAEKTALAKARQQLENE